MNPLNQFLKVLLVSILFTYAGICAAASSPASSTFNARGAAGHARWDDDGKCHLHSASGFNLGVVEESLCPGLSHAKWNEDGKCHRYNGAGTDVEKVDSSLCWETSYFKRNGEGFCHVFNGAGFDMRVVDSSFCYSLRRSEKNIPASQVDEDVAETAGSAI